jgi:hypothetical protein
LVAFVGLDFAGCITRVHHDAEQAEALIYVIASGYRIGVTASGSDSGRGTLPWRVNQFAR